MVPKSSIYHHHSIRLKNYDYSQSGAYFVTICTHNREFLFCEIVNCKIVLNEKGKMVEKWWYELNNKFTNIETDLYVVMPNHFHGILVINNPPVEADIRVCTDNITDQSKGEHTGSALHKIVQWFKTMTTNDYIKNVKTKNWAPFDKKLWQRNYYEHIIRNEIELNRVREYIMNNPLKWELDFENPERKKEYKNFTDYLKVHIL